MFTQHSDNVGSRIHEAGLTLDTRLLAILEGTDLKFQSFHFLGRVFDVSEYFKEATAEDVKVFAMHEKFIVDDADSVATNVSANARRKITLILQSGILNSFSTAQIVAAALIDL